MEYLTLKISTADRGLIYEKDFGAAEVFTPFVRLLVSNMVVLGLLKDKQLYWAKITPGYDDRARAETVVSEGASADRGPDDRWLTFAVPEGAALDEAVKYFTVEVHTVPPQAMTFRKDYAATEVNDLFKRVKASLRQLNLLLPDEEALAQLFARRGDSPRFNQEVIHALPKELGDLGIKIEGVEPAPSFPRREVPRCDCGHGEDEESEDLLIFFKHDCLTRLGQHLARHASRQRETGGILIGRVFRRPQGEGVFVEIEDFIEAGEVEADAVSLRFTHATFRELRRQKALKFAADTLVVGWYHTHPPMLVGSGAHQRHTTSFFSADDLALHRQIFNLPWQVALVMDAESSEKIFFRWSGDSVVESDFHVSE